MANMIIDFGKKYKGKTIGDCDEKYLKWLVSHERVLAVRNRWASRDAAFELARRSQTIAQVAVVERIEAAVEAAIAVEQPHEQLNVKLLDQATRDQLRDIAAELGINITIPRTKENLITLIVGGISSEIKSHKRSADLGMRGNLNGNKAFSILR